MSDRVCFADIDGVVIPFGGHNKYNDLTPSPEAMETLFHLRSLGYRFILHSTWRHALLNEAYAMFAEAGVPLDDHVSTTEESKAKAIVDWLLDNYAGDWPAHILVIDDQDFVVPKSIHIKPDPSVGLTLDHLKLIAL